MTEQNYKGFYKVAECGGTFIVSTFYNPTTGECFHCCTRDYDYDDGRRDIDELYYLPLNEDVSKEYHRARFGTIFAGDTIEIIKGRKMVGEKKVVAGLRNFRPQNTYGNRDIVYLDFTDHTSCARHNCQVVCEKQLKPFIDVDFYSDVSKR